MDLLVNHPRYGDLLLALDAGEAWRSLGDIGDEYGSLLAPADLAQAQRRPSPAHFLLERISTLFDQPLTAEETAVLLQPLVGPAAAAAELLQPPQPLRVRPLADTNSACVWAPLGGRLLLRCEAVARPPPTYLWRRDGQPVPPSAGGESAELSLQPFAAADVGRYSCEVRDAAGMAVDAGGVCVQPTQAPPGLTSRTVTGGTVSDDGTVSAPGDRPLRLQVLWKGWPEPQMRWERDHQPLEGADGDTLTLQDVTEMADGKYVCVATNAVGEVKSEPFLVRFDQRPLIQTHPESAQRCHPIGRPLKLRCSAFCRRPLKVVWRCSLGEDGGRDKVLPSCQSQTTVDGNMVHSELTLTPTEAEARYLCKVTCEFLAAGDWRDNYENSFSQSKPGQFRVVYSAQSKMALIIGNSDYQYLTPLSVVKQDVAKFQEAMRELGFGTLVAMNLSTEKSRRVVEYFARSAAPGAYLVVLVAGHGFTQQRQDYLAPVDHPPLDRGAGADPSRCLSMLDDIEHRLQLTSPKVIVICGDMCRNEVTTAAPAAGPLSTHPPRSASNVVRLFSTQMGHEAMDDSKFMRCLLKNIHRDITVQQMGMETLEAVSGSSPAAAQILQHPIVEVSIADRRSLLDPADNLTALDVLVHRSYQLQGAVCRWRTKISEPPANWSFRLEANWSNYVWDSEPELLLTLRLCDAPADYYVQLVTAYGQPPPRFKLESGDSFSSVSSWRAMGLPPDGGLVSLRPVVFIAGPNGQLVFLPAELRLRLNEKLGLVDGSDVAPPAPSPVPAPAPAADAAERKISNVQQDLLRLVM